MRKFSFFVLAAAAIAVGIIACRKGASDVADTTFNTGAAKEWYYGTFKKSALWSSSRLIGKKLPDWKNGIYKKIGNMELVEFPLITGKKLISVQPGTAIGIEAEKIAEASLNRVVFIKKPNGQIAVRELNYIPDPQYLQQHGFDVSDASLVKGGGNFTGRVIVKDWTGMKLGLLLMQDGSIVKRGKMKSKAAQSSISARTENCTTFEVCEYEQVCTEYYSGDVLIEETCDPWTATGNCWLEEYCEDAPCTGTETECACSTFNICEDDGGGGGGGDEEECNVPSASEAMAGGAPVSESVEEGADPAVTTGGVTTRIWRGKWKFYTGHWTFYTWHYISWDEGTHKLDGTTWKWETLVHKAESTVGSSPFTTTLTMTNTVATIATNKLSAEMNLYYEVKMCIECVGVPMGCSSKNENSSHLWPAGN